MSPAWWSSWPLESMPEEDLHQWHLQHRLMVAVVLWWVNWSTSSPSGEVLKSIFLKVFKYNNWQQLEQSVASSASGGPRRSYWIGWDGFLSGSLSSTTLSSRLTKQYSQENHHPYATPSQLIIPRTQEVLQVDKSDMEQPSKPNPLLSTGHSSGITVCHLKWGKEVFMWSRGSSKDG